MASIAMGASFFGVAPSIRGDDDEVVTATATTGFPSPVTALAFTPDGNSVAAACQGEISVVRWPDLQVAHRIAVSMSHVHDLAFAPDGTRLLVAGGAPGETGVVEVFAWPRVESLQRVADHDDVVMSVAWRPDSQAWASASADRTLRIHAADDGRSLQTMGGHSRDVTGVAWLPDGETLVSTSLDQSLRVWKANRPDAIRTLENHTQGVVALAAPPGASTDAAVRIATAGDDGTIRFWQPTVGRMLRFARLESRPKALAWSPDESVAVVACEDGQLRIVETKGAKEIGRARAVEGWAYCVAVAPDGASAVVGGERGQIVRVALRDPPGVSRPNILWITCEDMSPDLGCYGDSYARSPNIDRLAATGRRYTRCFTHAPVCAPSRSGLITGMYPTTIGTHHMRCQGVPPQGVKCFTEHLRSRGYFCTNNWKTDYNFDSPLTAWDENGQSAHWRHRVPGQPFFAVFNFTTTHESQIRADDGAFAAQTARLAAADRHDPTQARLPAFYPEAPEIRRDWARYHDLITTMDLQVGDLLAQLAEDGLERNTIVFFFSDHGRGLPRCKRWPYDSGLHVPLIVRWPGRIAGGETCDDLTAFIDFAPTVLSLAGAAIPPAMQGQVFLGPEAAPPREYVFAARDRMDETYDLIRSVRDRRFHYLRNYQPEKPYAQKIDYAELMPTLQTWRRLHAAGSLSGPAALFFSPRKPEEELYDTEEDPDEVQNLADDPRYRAELQRLRTVHERWTKETHDLGHTPEMELNEARRPEGEWSIVRPPKVTFVGAGQDRAEISCDTAGASIAYTLEEGETPRWRLYVEPIQVTPGAIIRTKACRLGWRDSEEATAVAGQ